MGHYSQSIEYLDKALRLHYSIYGENHLATANVFDSLGFAYQGHRESALAVENYRNALRIIENLFGSEDSRAISVRKRIAEINKQ